jgi:hypothetical protein
MFGNKQGTRRPNVRAAGVRVLLAASFLIMVGAEGAIFAAPAPALTPHYYINGTSEAAKVIEGAKVPILAWGTLTLEPGPPFKSVPGPHSCENSTSGFAENPLGGGAGKGQTSSFTSWNCENATSCPSGAEIEFPPGSGKKVTIESAMFPGGEADGVDERVLGQSLPWPGELTEATAPKIREEMKGVVEILGCEVHKSIEGSPPLGDGDRDTPQFVKKLTICFTNPGPGAKLEPLTENGSQIGGTLTSKLKFGTGSLLCRGESETSTEEITFSLSITGSVKVFTYEGQELIDTIGI